MIKTKKKFLLIALLSIVAMLCCGMALLFAPTSVANPASTNLTVKAVYDGYDYFHIGNSSYYYGQGYDSENESRFCYCDVDTEQIYDALPFGDYSGYYYDTTYGIIYGYFTSSHTACVVGWMSSGILYDNVDVPENVTLSYALQISGVNYYSTTIAAGALYECPMTSLTIPDGYVGMSGESGDCYVTDLHLPSTLTSMSSGLAGFAGYLQNLYVPNYATLFGISWEGIEFSYPVNLYVNNVLTTSITIPDSVSTVDFCYLPKLGTITSITLPSTLSNFTVSDDITGLNTLIFPNDNILNSEVCYVSSLDDIFKTNNGEARVKVIVPMDKVVKFRTASTEDDYDFDWKDYADWIYGAIVTDSGIKYGLGDGKAYLIDFSAASALSTITIPASISYGDPSLNYAVTKILQRNEVNSLSNKDVIVNATLTDIYWQGLSGAKSVTFSSSTVPEIAQQAFSNDTKFFVPSAKYNEYKSEITVASGRAVYCVSASVTVNGVEYYLGKTSNDGPFVAFAGGYTNALPSTVTFETSVNINGDDYDALLIGASAFKGSSMTSLIIPDGYTSISSYAFSSCNSLKSVIVPSSVTYIDSFSPFPSSVVDVYTASQQYPSGIMGSWKQYTVENNVVIQVENSQVSPNSVIGGTMQVDSENVYSYKHWIKTTVASSDLSVLTLSATERLSAAPEESNLWVLSANGKTAQKVVYNNGLVGPLPTAESGEELNWLDSEENAISNSTLFSNVAFANNEMVLEAETIPEPPETGIVLDIILPSAIIVMVLVATIVVWKKKEY